MRSYSESERFVAASCSRRARSRALSRKTATVDAMAPTLGSNGENECPELPVGVDIKTAYGHFVDRWDAVADQLETPPIVSIR